MDDMFGIYVADADGQNARCVLSDPVRELSHPRVSPNGKQITFTRYNSIGKDGLATEDGGYLQTEICTANSDGTVLHTLAKPLPDIVNANSSWWDNTTIMYLSNYNRLYPVPVNRGLFHIALVTAAGQAMADLPTPRFNVSDPHRVGDTVVFPGILPKLPNWLWIMDKDGHGLRLLTHTTQSDYDPRVSPDGKMVAFMRLYGLQDWHVCRIILATGITADLTGDKNNIEGVPDWAPDSKTLIFRHMDLANPDKMGIYTMAPDGSNRVMLPLPRGLLHNHPGYFPDGKRIVFSARKVPGLP